MKEKKFVTLSKASLDKVWAWCEENESDPLAEAFMGACTALGTIDCSKISDRLKKSWPGGDDINSKKWGGWIDAAYVLDDLAFIHRDTLGRAILDMLKRERPNVRISCSALFAESALLAVSMPEIIFDDCKINVVFLLCFTSNGCKL